MPYSGAPETVARDAIRVLVGDLSTSASGEFMGDAEYDYFANTTPNAYIGAQLAANSLAALFTAAAASASGSGYVEKAVGDLKIKKADAVQAAASFRALASEFGRRAAAGITPFSGGMSISDKATNTSDTDKLRPAFISKLFDNAAAIDFAGSTST